MESTVWLVILSTLLLLALLAATVQMSLMQHRANREQMSLLQNLVERTMAAATEGSTRMLSEISSQLSESQVSMMMHLQETTKSQTQATQVAMTQATGSLGSTIARLSELLRETTAIAAASDVAGYQVMSAAPAPADSEPYTSTEDLAYEEALRGQIAAGQRYADEALNKIANLMGVPDESHYPVAGSDFGFPAPTAP